MKYMVKILVVCLMFFGFIGLTTSTGDLWNWMDNLNDEIPFGYTVNQKITVERITSTSIVIKSPVIQDELGNKIKKYTVMYSQYPLSQILENTTYLDQSKEKTFDFATVDTQITMELKSLEDVIDPSKIYYLSVIPKDQNGILGEISNEIWFRLSDQTSGEGIPSTTNSSLFATHGAGADMNLAHVTHTISRNKVTLQWTAIDGSDKIDIFLWNPTNETFDKLARVNMNDEKYNFTLTRNGEYIINFIPNNGGKEYRYTFTVQGVVGSSTPTTPTTIGHITPTGPRENIFVIFGISVLVYLVYRKLYRKH